MIDYLPRRARGNRQAKLCVAQDQQSPQCCRIFFPRPID
jgi:hypothetical protein